MMRRRRRVQPEAIHFFGESRFGTDASCTFSLLHVAFCHLRGTARGMLGPFAQLTEPAGEFDPADARLRRHDRI